MAAVTKEQLENAALDAETYAQVVNGPAAPGTVLNRDGEPLKTLAKLESEYQAQVDAQEVQQETATAQAVIATTQAGIATAQATAAAGSAADAAELYDLMLALDGVVDDFDTKALAVAGLAGIPADASVIVWNDETHGGRSTVYRKTGGVLVFTRQLYPGVVNGLVSLSAFLDEGAPNEQAALEAAAVYAAAAGLRGVQFDIGTTRLKGTFDDASLWLPSETSGGTNFPGTKVNVDNTILDPVIGDAYGARQAIFPYMKIDERYEIVAPFDADSNLRELDTVVGLAPGDWILERYFDIPLDTPEPYNGPRWNRVKEVEADGDPANSIRVRSYRGRSFTAAQLAAAVGNKHIYKATPIIDEVSGYVRVTPDMGFNTTGFAAFGWVGGALQGVHCVGADNIMAGQYIQGAYVGHVYVADAEHVDPYNSGASMRWAETELSFGNVVIDNCYAGPGGEAGTRLRFSHIDLTRKPLDVPYQWIIGNTSRSHMSVGLLEIKGVGDYRCSLTNLQGGSSFHADVVQILTHEPIGSMGVFGREIGTQLVIEPDPGDADLTDPTENPREEYNVARKVTRTYIYGVTTNGYGRAHRAIPPKAIITDCRQWASSGATAGLHAYIHADVSNENQDFGSLIEAGKWKSDPNTGQVGERLTGNIMNGRREESRSLVIIADAEGGAVPDLTGQQMMVELSFIRDEMQDEVDQALAHEMSGRYYFAYEVDVPELLAGARHSQWLATPGATCLFGDRCKATLNIPGLGAGLDIRAEVVWYDGSVEFVLVNDTGGPVNPAAGILQLWVRFADVF